MSYRDDEFPFNGLGFNRGPSLPKVYGPLVRPPETENWKRRPPLAPGAPYQAANEASHANQPLSDLPLAPNRYGVIGPRLYRQAWVSPMDASNPIDRLQVVPTSVDPKEGLVTDADLAKVEDAVRFLDKSDQARASINAGLRKGVRLDLNSAGKTQYHTDAEPTVAKRNVIDWDPEVQLRLMNDDRSLRDEYQSPALGLGHEFEHYASPFSYRVDMGPIWKNNEEKRVVTGWETPVARELKEPERNNYLGLAAYRTRNPLGIEGGVLDLGILEPDRAAEWETYFQANPTLAGKVRGPLSRR